MNWESSINSSRFKDPIVGIKAQKEAGPIINPACRKPEAVSSFWTIIEKTRAPILSIRSVGKKIKSFCLVCKRKYWLNALYD